MADFTRSDEQMPYQNYWRKDTVRARKLATGMWELCRYNIQTDATSCWTLPEGVFLVMYQEENLDAGQIASPVLPHASGQSGTLQENEHSVESGETVRKRGEAPKAGQTICCYYRIEMDAWCQLPHRSRRIIADDHPLLVWMQLRTWEKLANCANRNGEFYIPVVTGLQEPWQLRQQVLEMEKS